MFTIGETHLKTLSRSAESDSLQKLTTLIEDMVYRLQTIVAYIALMIKYRVD